MCNKKVAPILDMNVSKSEVCHNIIIRIVYGELQYQGLGIKYWFPSVGIENIRAILEHAWLDTTTWSVLQYAMEQLKLKL